jgi:hypothetical protein
MFSPALSQRGLLGLAADLDQMARGIVGHGRAVRAVLGLLLLVLRE